MSEIPVVGARYALDDTDEIVSVNETWLEFARANAAAELTREAVVGRCLWDFIDGDETRRLYELIFSRVRRDGVAVTIPFRCDSPTCYRFMELQLSPSIEGGIVAEGIVIREQVRVYLPLIDAALERADYSYPMCGLCKQVFVFGEWLEPESAVARLDMFDSSRPPRLDPAVCPRCQHTHDVLRGRSLSS